MPVDSIATVVIPHSASQSAMATKSQELAPKRRTLAGNAPASTSADGKRSAGTHTMCISECTSMPAALGLRTSSVTGWSRGGRDGFGGTLALAGLPFAGEDLRLLMVSATLLEWGEDSRRGP